LLRVALQHLIDFLFPPQCGGCGRIGTGACERCMPRDPAMTFALGTLHVTALGAYAGRLRRAVLALKTGRRDVAKTFAQRLSEIVRAGEVLAPVPTTRARRRERGFDGCELLAGIVAQRTGAAVVHGLVQTAGDRQRGRNRDARLAAHGRFARRGNRLDGVRVTLLDDVVTTGATLEDCAATLRGCGAIVERAIVVAKA